MSNSKIFGKYRVNVSSTDLELIVEATNSESAKAQALAQLDSSKNWKVNSVNPYETPTASTVENSISIDTFEVPTKSEIPFPTIGGNRSDTMMPKPTRANEMITMTKTGTFNIGTKIINRIHNQDQLLLQVGSKKNTLRLTFKGSEFKALSPHSYVKQATGNSDPDMGPVVKKFNMKQAVKKLFYNAETAKNFSSTVINKWNRMFENCMPEDVKNIQANSFAFGPGWGLTNVSEMGGDVAYEIDLSRGYAQKRTQ
tara:strand:- start:500 stop:1264 length:765 start_codon:yes stop_codon:yes gene_type:complete